MSHGMSERREGYVSGVSENNLSATLHRIGYGRRETQEILRRAWIIKHDPSQVALLPNPRYCYQHGKAWQRVIVRCDSEQYGSYTVKTIERAFQ